MADDNPPAPTDPNAQTPAEPCTGNRASGQPIAGARFDWRGVAQRQAERRAQRRAERRQERQAKDRAKRRKKRRAYTMKVMLRLNACTFKKYKVSSTTLFRNVFLAFCVRHNIDRSVHRFMYGSVQISDHDTPGGLGVENGAIIDCMIRGSSTVAPVCFRRSSLDNVVTVRPRPPQSTAEHGRTGEHGRGKV